MNRRNIDKAYLIKNKKTLGIPISLNSIVAEQYSTQPIANGIYCSAQDYADTPLEIKTPGFPCLLKTTINGQSHHYQLLTPEIVAIILEHKGFKVIGGNKSPDKDGAITILARRFAP